MASTTTNQEIIEAGSVVHTTICYNPFNSIDRQQGEITWREELTLKEALGDLPDDLAWLVLVNGDIKTEEEYDEVYLHANDNLFIQPVPEGGGSGKQILAVVLSVVLAVVAPLAGAALFGSGTLLAAVASGVILAVGGVLISSLVPPPDEISNDGAQDEQTFGLDGPKNTSSENQSVPLVYGTYRVGGNITNIFTEPSETDNQIVRMMSVVSEGQVEEISDFYINGQSSDNYRDIQTSWRRGTLNQSKIEWFDDSIVPVNRNATLTENFTLYTTTQDVNAFRLDIVFPSGLIKFKSSGAREQHEIVLEGHFRKVGDTAWLPLWVVNADGDRIVTRTEQELLNAQAANSAQGGLSGVFINASTGSNNRQRPLVGQAEFIGKQRSTMRRYVEVNDLETAKYEVRIKRVTPISEDDKIVDGVVLSDVNEIRTEDISYRHTAHYGMSIRLTDQLSSLPQISALVKGIRCKHYDFDGNITSTEYTTNPAWIVADLLTNDRYGGGLPIANVDWPRFLEWAEHNVDKDIEFNGVFYDSRTVWDCVQDVMRVSGAQIVRSGTKYTVIIEKEEEPSAMFNNSNILEDSMSINWLPADSRANVVEVRFYDEDEGYKARTVRVVDFEALARGVPERPVSIQAKGITNIDKAYFYANVVLARNKYMKQTVTFDVHNDAITSVVGDVVYIQHDMPQWGFGGRLESGSTDTVIKFDREVEMAAGARYSLIIRHSAVTRATATVIAKSTNLITLDIGEPSETIRRLREPDGSRDTEIRSVVELSSSSSQYSVESSTGINVGDAVELVDVDVLDKIVIDNPTVFKGKEYTLTTPLQAVPEIYAPYAIGRIEQASKRMRISSIDTDSDFVKTVTALEYNPAVYSDPENAEPAPSISALNDSVEPVTNVEFTEDLVVVNGNLEVRLATSWTAVAGSSYGGAQITYYDEEGFIVDSKTVNSDLFTDIRTVEDRERVRVEIWPYGINGQFLEPRRVERHFYRVVGKLADPEPVNNARVIRTSSGVTVAWDFSQELDVVSYEVWFGPNFGSAVSVSENITSNSVFTDKVSIGLNVYHVVAVDSLGNKSTPAVATYEKVPPSPILDFNAVRVGQTIALEWRAVESASFYEIRRGTSWSAGALVTRVDALQFTTPIDHTQENQTFFIKTVDSDGDYSEASSSVTISIRPLALRNILEQENYRGLGFPGGRMGLIEQIDGDLQIESGLSQGEYILPALGDFLNSRVVYDDFITNSVDFQDTWEDADYSWDSPEANARFETVLENQDAIFFKDVSLKDDTPIPGLYDAIPLYGNLNSITSQTTNQTFGSPSFSYGRFQGGLDLTGAANTSYRSTFGTPISDIQMNMWATPLDLTATKFYFRLFAEDNGDGTDIVELFSVGSQFVFRYNSGLGSGSDIIENFTMRPVVNGTYFISFTRLGTTVSCEIYDAIQDITEKKTIVTPVANNFIQFRAQRNV